MADEIIDVHPLDGAFMELATLSDEDVRGTARLGSLAFDDAPGQVQTILGALGDIRLEDWDSLDSKFRSDLATHAATVIETLNDISQMDASDPSANQRRTRNQNKLNQETEWFKANVRPRAFQARLAEALKRQDGLARDREQTELLRQELEELHTQIRQAQIDLAELQPVVEAGRQVAGESGAADLAVAYENQAEIHEKLGTHWQKILVAAGIVATVGSILVVSIHHPSGEATTAAAVGRFLIDLLVIGLLLYGVRFASLQCRVHRHLEALDRSKAAALTTFARMVATGAEPATRDVLATALAQAVFAPGSSGFTDGGTEHITLIERVASLGAQRLGGG